MESKPQMVVKEQEVAFIKEAIEGSTIMVLTDYRGLNVAEVSELRNKLREVGASMKVAKNTLIKRAANSLDVDALDSYLEGPTAVAYCPEPASMAKVLVEFAKEHENLEIKAGILDKNFMALDAIKALAELPSREVLLAKVLGGMQAPLSGFAGVTSGLLRQTANVLDQIKTQKENA